MNFPEKTIFVSGATGFIGGRVCERLAQEGARDVRALVHDIQHAPRIARLPVQLCVGDLLDAQSLRANLGKAKLAIHLGLGHGGAIVKGTRNLLEVARAAGVERFVHISTTAVYGLRPSPGCETEEAPTRRSGDAYCDNKITAERVVEKFSKCGLPTVTLRPSIVCGPYSRWSTRSIDGLKQGTITLIDGGDGICNTTYVDNLVDAIFLALESSSAVGQVFTITDGETPTWGDFIRAHAAMIDPSPALSQISTERLLAYYRDRPGLLRSTFQEVRRILVSAEFRQMIKRTTLGERIMTKAWLWVQSLDDKAKDRLLLRLSGRNARNSIEDRAFVPDLDTWKIQSQKVKFSISKARKILGYEPRISFIEGIRLTELWLRFANYL